MSGGEVYHLSTYPSPFGEGVQDGEPQYFCVIDGGARLASHEK